MGVDQLVTGNDPQNPNVQSLATDEVDAAIEEGSNIIGSRSFDTTYQNTTGHVLAVSVIVRNLTSTQDVGAALYVKSGSSSIVAADNEVCRNLISSIDGDAYITVSALVPDQHHYRIADNGGADNEAYRWFERGFTA